MKRDIFDFDNKVNFWEHFPELVVVPEFAELKKKMGDTESSKVMWALQLCLNPDSKIYNATEKWDIVKGRLTPEKWDWEVPKNKILIDKFIDITFTEAQKTLINLDIFLKHRNEFLKTSKMVYEAISEAKTNKAKLDILKQLESYDKMAANTTKLMDEYNKAKKLIADEDSLKVKKINTSEEYAI